METNIVQTNSGLGYQQLAYLLVIPGGHLCIGHANIEDGESGYTLGELVNDVDHTEPSTFKIEESPLYKSYLFHHFLKNPPKYWLDVFKYQEIDGYECDRNDMNVIRWTKPGCRNKSLYAIPNWNVEGKTSIHFNDSALDHQPPQEFIDQAEFKSFEDYYQAVKPYLERHFK